MNTVSPGITDRVFHKRRLAIPLPGSLLVSLFACSVHGADIVVSSPADSGPGTLRQALVDAAAAPGADVITFHPGLSGQFISLTTNTGGTALTIASGEDITVDAGALPGGLFITDGAGTSYRLFTVLNGGSLTLRGLTLANGGGTAFTQEGGAVWCDGTLIMDRCLLAGNSAAAGGALRILGEAWMVNCTFYGNVGTATGGAAQVSGFAWFRHCTIAENVANGGNGGGVNVVADGALVMENSIIAGNVSAGAGANVFNAGVVEIEAPCVVHSAIAGPGLLVGAVTIANPLLNPLAWNGGASPTLSLQAGSPALDAGTVVEELETDQRGLPRVRDGTGDGTPLPDLGAYEAQVKPAAGIGLNFTGGVGGSPSSPGGILAASESAGVPPFAQANWNNLATAHDGNADGTAPNAQSKRDATGAVISSLQLWWDAPNTWAVSGTIPATPNGRLMNGYLDSNGTILAGPVADLRTTSGAQPYVSIGGLPADLITGGYKVISYADFGSTSGRVISYWLTGNSGRNPASVAQETTLTPRFFIRDASNFSGTFTRASSTSDAGSSTAAANYVQFDSRTEDGFTLRAEESSSVSGTLRAPVNGLQIVRNEIIAVTTAADELDPPGVTGNGVSLREAIRDAADGGGIVFDAHLPNAIEEGVIALDPALGELVITKNLVLDARGLPGGLLLWGSGTSRILRVVPGRHVAIIALTLGGGNASSSVAGGLGGAIYNQGILTIHRCTFTDNHADGTAPAGGAIFNAAGGWLIMSACTLTNNSASARAGAFLNAAGAAATITHCTFQGNASDGTDTIHNEGSLSFAGSIVAGTLHNSSTGSTVRVGLNLVTSLTSDPLGPGVSGPAHLASDPMLSEPDFNGGPTMTMALLIGSPARNAATGSPARTDQRGYPVVGIPDLGACEEDSWLPIPGTVQHMETFDTLPAATVLWSDHTILPGWRAQMNNGVTGPGVLSYNDGSFVADGLVNCGSSGSSDRALGSKSTSTSTSANANISYGATFRNTSAGPVKLARLRYAAEHWRSGQAAGMQERYRVFYAVSQDPIHLASGASSPTAEPGPGFTALSTWADSFLSNPTANTALNGNLTANRSLVDFTPAGGSEPVIPAGYYFTIKWTDPNEPSFDGHQSIDDVILNFVSVSPTLVLGSTDGGASPVWLITASAAPPAFRQTSEHELTIDPGTATLTTDSTPLTPGPEKCLTLTIEAVETSNSGGFEAADTFKVELLIMTPGGLQTQNLTSEFDLNADGVMSGGATAAADEFNSGQKPGTMKWTSTFPMVGHLPADATSFQIRISSNLDGQPVFPSTEILRVRNVSIVPCTDTDSDGVNDAWERAHGTDPASAASHFRLTEIARAGPNFTATVPTVSSRIYQPLISGALDTWHRDGLPAAGTGNPWTFQKPEDAAARRFFRILVLPAPTEQP